MKLCWPFNQNLHWDPGSGHLTCVQNVIAGRAWRLGELDLARAVADGRRVPVRRLKFPSHDELEGEGPLGGRRKGGATRSEAGRGRRALALRP